MGNRHIPKGMVSNLRRALEKEPSEPREGAHRTGEKAEPDQRVEKQSVQESTTKRRRRLAIDFATRPTIFEFRPMFGALLAMAVFFFTLRVWVMLPIKNPALLRAWHNEQAFGMSLFEQLMLISILFAVYALLDIIASVQRNHMTLVGAINYGASVLLLMGMMVFGLDFGRTKIEVWSVFQGPWTGSKAMEVDYPRVETGWDVGYHECYPEDAILVSVDETRLVVGSDVETALLLKDGRISPEKVTSGRAGPWIPELGDQLLAAHRDWEEKKSQSHFIKYRLNPPEVALGFEIWTGNDGVAELVIKADRKLPFETIEKVIISAGESGFRKWCLWGSEFETELFPSYMEFPKFAMLDGAQNTGSDLDLRLHLRRDELTVSRGRAQASEGAELVLSGGDQLKQLTGQLRMAKKLFREEVQCLLTVDPDVRFERVVETIDTLSGTVEEPLFPDVLFLRRGSEK